MFEKLHFLYDAEDAESCFREIDRLLKVYYAHKSPKMIEWEKTYRIENRFMEKDVILITYGDLTVKEGESSLKTLTYICDS
jgi:hypothetical protein